MAGRSAEFMRSIAKKGGEAMRARLEVEPDYYKRITSMGGRVTAAKRRADKAARLLAGMSHAEWVKHKQRMENPEPPPVDTVEKPVETERKPERVSSVLERMRKAVEK